MSETILLLVEDNEDDLYLTTRVLKKLPFPVKITAARNGDEALKMIAVASQSGSDVFPSVVMLDLQMPRIGGLRLLARIRELFSQEELPAIILSSSDNPGDIETCRELGISAYLQKPLDLQALQEVLLPLRPAAGNRVTPP